jgi:hypothetical protein
MQRSKAEKREQQGLYAWVKGVKRFFMLADMRLQFA